MATLQVPGPDTYTTLFGAQAPVLNLQMTAHIPQTALCVNLPMTMAHDIWEVTRLMSTYSREKDMPSPFLLGRASSLILSNHKEVFLYSNVSFINYKVQIN